MKQGQASLEYIFLIGLAAAAIIAMSVYLSRGFQGRLRGQANEVGEQYSLGGMSTSIVETSAVNLISSVVDKKSDSTVNSITVKTGHENVVRPLKEEHWDRSW